MNHEFYIKRCIDLAYKALGYTYPNPLVGSIIVHEGKIIGEGFHKKAGEAHAEVHAINAVENKELLKNSTLYVTLEPCSHFGKTPPCANKIVENGFKNVVIGTLDPHEKVNGKGKKILEDAGITVVSGVLEQECQQLNKRFFTHHLYHRPYIILKWSESHDGFMDKNFKPFPISNDLVNQMTHRLRAVEHAIIVGTNTAMHDNPSLTTRNVAGKNPVRIVLDLNLKIPTHYKIYNGEAPTIIFNAIKNEENHEVKFIKIDPNNVINDILQHLYALQVQSLIVEGGRTMLQQFIDAGLWDEALVIKNPELLLENGTKKPDFDQNPIAVKDYRGNQVYYYESKR